MTNLARILTDAAATAAFVFALITPLAPRVFAQETVSRDVWLGSQIFGVEDLEALDRAARLSTDQRDAAQELMRSALPQARSLVVQWSRGYSELSLDPSQGDDWDSMRPKYAELSKRIVEDAARLEADVMTNLRSLLNEDQLEGWAAFERHRRRLVLRAEGGRADVDVFGMVRAIKPTPAEWDLVSPMLDSYERSLDSMLQEYRPLLRKQGDAPSRWYAAFEPLTPQEQEQFISLTRRISQLHVRTARQIAEQLPEEKRIALQKQRLFAEERDNEGFESFRGLPHIRSALAIRSLSGEQKQRIKQLTRDADETLLRALLARKNEGDLKILAGEDPDHALTDADREAQTRKLRFEAYQTLMQQVAGVLSPDQKRAFETGIEDAADIERLFARRRYAADRWSLDRDLWDNDADRVPLATADEE